MFDFIVFRKKIEGYPIFIRLRNILKKIGIISKPISRNQNIPFDFEKANAYYLSLAERLIFKKWQDNDTINH